MSAALAVGNIVKRRIEEEMHKRDTKGGSSTEAASDSVLEDGDVKYDDDDENVADHDGDEDGSAPAEV